MEAYDMVRVNIPGKGIYENCLDDKGRECEWLDGVTLSGACYCKHYKKARDWGNKEALDKNGVPVLQHYCSKEKAFMGWAYCCGLKCFEEGKSAGVKLLRNKIHKKRLSEGLAIE